MSIKVGIVGSGFFDRLFGKTPSFPDTAPDRQLFVIGDIHGRVDLLERLLKKVNSDDHAICVGDYVDRGERSAEVLALLQGRPDILCLKGNHEDMMCKFLEDPQSAGARWLRYGGLQTMASYSIAGVSESSKEEELNDARDRLAEAMGPAVVDWLQGLETWHKSGNVAVVHAAADPFSPIDQQSNSALMWGHPDFEKTVRSDGVWVVHGHTIVDQPSAEHGRIAIDTGAYATGRLTAARIAPGSVEFVTA